MSGDKSEQVTFCGDDGVWSPAPKECSLTCGKVQQKSTSPWIVKIGRYVGAFVVYELGTIINARMVLSVADPFWNRTTQETNDLSEFWIEIEGKARQKVEIDQIAFAPNHDKIMYAPSGNVVVLILRTTIDFKTNVIPICLPFELFADGNVPSTFEGLTPEQDNVVVELPTTCYSELKSSSPPSIAVDVLCTNMNSTSKYIGTGSSFAVPIETNGSQVYYLVGIRTWFHKYNGVKYYQFQNILFYKEFIQSVIISHENEKYSNVVLDSAISTTLDLSTTAITTTVSTTTQSTTTSSSVDEIIYCRLDNIPIAGNAYYESNPNQRLQYGEKISNFISIEYRCIENHVLYGNSSNFCIDGKWIFTEPECKPRCSSKKIMGWTLVANCKIDENTTQRDTSCNAPAVPGTIATVNCQQGYQRFGSYSHTAVCGSDGRWNPLPEKCTPICGEISHGDALIVGGNRSAISKVPWHAGIYRKYRENYGFEQICGGSIISSKVIVSAMHCFWNSSVDKAINKDEYEVAVGKTLRRLEENENLKPQFFKIAHIFYEEGYADYAGNYADDIAVVISNNFIEFRPYIAPVCIHFDLKYEEKIVESGLIGKVAGWGLEQSNGLSSSSLKEIDLPVISRKNCLRHSTEEFKRFITSDKFCAGYLTGMSVCQGDSGGGYVIPEGNVYYLRGIVSTGVNKEGSCDNDKYATFTNIAYYTDLIRKHYVEYQPSL